MNTGEQIEGYELIEKLGAGGIGEVWKARDRDTGRVVAIKFLVEEYQQRFRAEWKTQAALRHAHIVQVLNFVAAESHPFLVTEYIEGGSLDDLLRQHPEPMPWRQAVALSLPVLAALDHAHHLNIVHRDVKPSNILLDSNVLDSNPNVRLTGFGIARGVRRPASLAPEDELDAVGAIDYMSPEEIVGSVGVAGDVYSVGAVLYKMLTGRRPYEGERGHVNDAPRSPREFNPHIPPALEAAVLSAVQTDPRRRFASAQQMLQTLEALLADAPPVREAAPVPIPWDAPAISANSLEAPRQFWQEVLNRSADTFFRAAVLTFGIMSATAVILFLLSFARKYVF